MSQIGIRTGTTVSHITDVVISQSYSSIFTLAIIKNVGANGLSSWVDMGEIYDTIESKCKIELLNTTTVLEDFESNLKGSASGELTKTIVLQSTAGFYPLTPLYKKCVLSGDSKADNYYELSLTSQPQPQQVNIANSAVQYEFSVIPNGTDLTLADAYESCGNYTGWTLDGLDLPYSENTKPVLNIVDKSKALNIGADNPRQIKKVNGESVKITLTLDEEKTRQLLAKLKALRGEEFTIVTPLNYNYFAHLYPTATSFKCILNDNKVSVDTSGHKNIKVSFSIQLTAVL